MSTALVLINLGSPDSPKVSDVRKYLNQFLMDKNVIDIPYLLRWILVKGIISPIRAPKSAHKYQKIWTQKGSPLITITQELTQLVEKKTLLPTFFSMRYGNPSPMQMFQEIINKNPDVKNLIVFPLYPHYAMSSYETALQYLKDCNQQLQHPFQLQIIPPFYRHPNYINALTESINKIDLTQFDHLLFSYHGIPVRHLKKTDPTQQHCYNMNNCCQIDSKAHATCYLHQVKTTSKLVAEKLGLTPDFYSISFQSRLGADEWIQPYSDQLFKDFPKKGIKKLLVISPAFVSDCLETLEEISDEGKEIFLNNGGESYQVIPCLNTNDSWVEAIHSMVKEVNNN